MLYESAPLSVHEFEATEGPVMGADGASAGTDTAPSEPVGAEAPVGAAPTSEPAVPTEALPEPAQESWAPSREDWEQQQQALAQVYGLLPQIAPQFFSEPEPEPVELDPFADDFGSQVANLIEQKAQEIAQQQIGPMVPFVESQIEERGEQMARQHLEGFSAELGKFDQDMALRVAAGLHQAGGDPARSLREAAQQVSQYEQRLKQQGVNEWVAQHQENQNAPSLPSAGLQVVEGNGYASVEDAKRAVIERHRG